jgi:hypothetical protein
MTRNTETQIEHQAWLRRDPEYYRAADYIPDWSEPTHEEIDHRDLVMMQDVAADLVRMTSYITQEERQVDAILRHAYSEFARELPKIERAVREFRNAMLGSKS